MSLPCRWREGNVPSLLKYLVGTNVCIKYLTNRSASVVAQLGATKPGDIALCSVVKAELLYGS
jgi:tRNA(fMet)-specific endonuclease VapC